MEDCGKIWTWVQLFLPGQIRWKRFFVIDPEMRQQNDLQHTYSFLLFVMMACTRLARRYRGKRPVDYFLIFLACMLHDLGEPALGYEVEAPLKTPLDDVNEYNATRQLFESHLPADLFGQFHRAYLLQLVFKTHVWPHLPEDAQAILGNLRTHRNYEARLFRVFEPLDYVLMGLEQVETRNSRYVLKAVVDKDVPFLDREIPLIPGAAEFLWTPALRQRCIDLVEGVISIDKQ